MKTLNAIKPGLMAVLGSVLCAQATAKEAPAAATPLAGKVFAEHYQTPPAVGADQTQVVYYRPLEGLQRSGSAHIYVNREFHTGLLPGGFTRFCLAPGTYTLGAYLKDAPLYAGKHTDLYQASLQGGRTYYLKVREDGDTFPLAVSREDASRELNGVRVQAHALSRASVLESCRHYDYLDGEPSRKDYSLSSDVLFAYGGGAIEDMSAGGRSAIRQWLKTLQKDDAQIRHIEVIGHTDPLGDEAENQLLGLRRADSVRNMLIENGLPESIISASSAGNREPLVHSCYGSLAQQISCYAPNRRVVLRVDLSKSGS
ncbi:OmpA family protein [Pseudomonas fluorescens]|uniref:OmpA family protein n=1 Tax=Pseudomonas fluorescens TaxID=294 RepID=UPI001A9F1AEE|nr:OmpA family protein [Pseudomonas fluorescens]QTD31474.1 OmpA family protein [Pseudomonas fluorescens]